MQFYIIHSDPTKSAQALPTYALKVNIREGWQILSDIGHRFGVHWPNQCKAYNPAHPWTRQFSHRDGFRKFINHLRACCAEYYNRTGKQTCWQDWFADFDGNNNECIPLPDDQEAETIHYLITAKAGKMTAEELLTLKGVKS